MQIANYIVSINKCLGLQQMYFKRPQSLGLPGFDPWSGKIPHAAEQLSHVPQLLSLRSRAREPQLLSLHATTTEACAPRARAPQEKPPQ